MAGGDAVRRVGEGEKVAREGHSACQRQEVSSADATEEIVEGRSRRCREKQQAGEGQESSDGGGSARRRRIGGSKGGHDGEEGNEDDYQAGDEGGLSRCCSREASGLELIAGGEEGSDDQSGEEGVKADVTELAMVHDGKGQEGERHAKQIEEKRRGVGQSVFYENKGCAPDEDDRQQQNVGEGGGTESLEQLLCRSRLGWR